MGDAKDAIGDYFRYKNKAWLAGHFVTDTADRIAKETERFRQMNDRRGVAQQKSDMSIAIQQLRVAPNEERASALVAEHMLWLYKMNDEIEEEERCTPHKLLLCREADEWRVVSDEPEVETFGLKKSAHAVPSLKEEQGDDWGVGDRVVVRPELRGVNSASTQWRRSAYNRLAAVRYAEVWWNSYNPAYRKFDVDCTSYTSQCLHAGGAPFVGGGTPSKGWWYRSGSEGGWSYSWAVAHSFRWFLANGGGVSRGWHAAVVADPRQLKLGDIICYDWNGDGHWQHSTIIVDFDATGMPLVNAHTVNSRRRYWDYSDSYAYTANTRYTFFHIPDAF